MKLVILSPVVSLNKLLRMHYQERRRLRLKYMWEMRLVLQELGEIIPDYPEEERKKLRIVSFGTKLMDKENLYGGAKVLIDAIKGLRLIYDDSPDWIDCKVLQDTKDKKRRTEIVIEEL
jgi:hypothetical protein